MINLPMSQHHALTGFAGTGAAAVLVAGAVRPQEMTVLRASTLTDLQSLDPPLRSSPSDSDVIDTICSRGHVDHSIGLVDQIKEPPFEPCMVMSLGVPRYASGLGGFNIEDMILVTQTGCENCNTLPHRLISLEPDTGGGRR